MWFYVEAFDPFGPEFCAVMIWIYLNSSTCRHPVRPAPFVEDALPFPLYGLVSLSKNHVPVAVWVYFGSLI